MSKYLFAIDKLKAEVIVSASVKGSNKIGFIERVSKHENAALYQAVVRLTELAQAPEFDMKEFKASDTICQEIYAKHKGLK